MRCSSCHTGNPANTHFATRSEYDIDFKGDVLPLLAKQALARPPRCPCLRPGCRCQRLDAPHPQACGIRRWAFCASSKAPPRSIHAVISAMSDTTGRIMSGRTRSDTPPSHLSLAAQTARSPARQLPIFEAAHEAALLVNNVHPQRHTQLDCAAPD
eukprot:355658-Chlamydomonas_euryale.AAC.12